MALQGNKNKFRTFQPEKWKKIKNNQPQTKFTGSYKKEECIYTNKNDTYKVAGQTNNILFTWNHEEADTRLILQALEKKYELHCI